MKKIAVVLFNLGGPDQPETIKPFLVNLFSDPAIIRLPALLRQIVARLIAARRTGVATDMYARLGGRSPILENTQAQASALEKELADIGTTKCFVAMRYWHPFTHETARAVRNFAPDEIVLLPLYPQFSTTTTASSFKSWQEAANAEGLNTPTKIICCYPGEPNFIKAIAQMVRAAYEKARAHGAPRVLFSAHGLPERIVKSGDPYQYQCEKTVAALVTELNIANLDWTLCYQSRVGPLQWIGPQTDEEIKHAGRDKAPLVIVPVAFVCEHAETLVELDIFYCELAAKAGVPYFDRVPTVGTTRAFIKGLADLVRLALHDQRSCISGEGGRLCPSEFSGCFNHGATQTE